MFNCPSCERLFQNITDFPLVYIVSVSIMKKGEVPEKIPGCFGEDVLEKKNSAWNRSLLPKEVSDYAKEHPGEKEFIHDNHIYYRPRDLNRKLIFWHREYNYSETIKNFLGLDIVKSYFNYLEGIVSKEVKTSEMVPRFFNADLSHLQLNDLFTETEGVSRTTKLNYAARVGRETNLNIQIGTIAYEGRINK